MQNALNHLTTSPSGASKIRPEALYDALAALAIDQTIFDSFRKAPDSLREKFQLSDGELHYLKGLDLEGFDLYRRIVIGTREARFEDIFSRTKAALGEIWSEVVLQFHREVPLYHPENDLDISAFIDFISRKTSPFIAEVVRIDAALYSLGQIPLQELAKKNDLSAESNSLAISPLARCLVVHFSAEDLMNPAEKNPALGESLGVLLTRSLHSAETEILEIPEFVAKVLGDLETHPKSSAELQSILTQLNPEASTVVEELLALGVLKLSGSERK